MRRSSRVRELVQQLEHRDVDAETERLMRNWSTWKSGGGIVMPMSCTTFQLEARGRREELSVPLINDDAVAVDDAVKLLAPEHQDVIEAYWRMGGTVRQKVRRCGCGSETFYRRLRAAHAQIRELIQERRQRWKRIADTRAKAAKGGKPPLSDRNKSV